MCLELAKLLAGFDLYLTHTIDVCGRLCPSFKLFTRGSGVYKYFLCDKVEILISISGLKNLMFAYYAGSAEKFFEFQNFVNRLKRSIKKNIFDFFYKNFIDFSKMDAPLYFMLLHTELLTLREIKKTSVNIEIDQTLSGVVFLAFLTRNRRLAEVVNLISLENSCPYTFCLENFKKFYEDCMEKRSERFFNFGTTNRELHKYALTRFCHNQTYRSRLEDFIEM